MAQLTTQSHESPRVVTRILVCAAIALSAGCIAYSKITATAITSGSAGDFTYYWLAAKAIVAGHSPYDVVHAGGQFQLKDNFLYPLPAALAVVPFASLSPVKGAVVFVSLISALLAWLVTRDGFARLPVFGSVPFFWFMSTGQLTPLLMCGALSPTLGFLFLLKPNLGVATVTAFPSRKAIVGCIILFAFSLALQPRWPLEWLHAVHTRNAVNYGSPLFLPGGFVLLACIFRWRRADARLLFMLSIVPQSLLFYDQILLWLIPRTLNESALLGITSFIGWFAATAMLGQGDTSYVSRSYGPAILISIYLPCLVMILLRKNEFGPPESARWSVSATAGR